MCPTLLASDVVDNHEPTDYLQFGLGCVMEDLVQLQADMDVKVDPVVLGSLEDLKRSASGVPLFFCASASSLYLVWLQPLPPVDESVNRGMHSFASMHESFAFVWFTQLCLGLMLEPPTYGDRNTEINVGRNK